MPIRFGALFSLAKKNCQTNAGLRQMVGAGGDSGPPDLLEMSPSFTEPRLPPAAGNTQPRCSIEETSVRASPSREQVCG